jgi:hypothetical protein
MLCNILANAFRGSLHTFMQVSGWYAYLKIGNDPTTIPFHIIFMLSFRNRPTIRRWITKEVEEVSLNKSEID